MDISSAKEWAWQPPFLQELEILKLNWLHTQKTTSFEQPEVTQLITQGCVATRSKSESINNGIRKAALPG